MKNLELGGVPYETAEIRQPDGNIPREDLNVLLGSSAHNAQVFEDDLGALWLIKPNTREKAYHERDMYTKLSKDVSTPPFPTNQRPYVEHDEDGTYRLVLPYVKGLQPLTRQNWQGYPGMPEFDERNKVLESLFGLAAKLHLRGYVHGDFQIKNVGSVPTGKLVLYDLERTQETSRMDPEEREKAEADDLISICKSLLINRFLERMDPDIQLQQFENYFQHYITKRKNINFESAFRAAGIAIDKLDQTLHDPDWLPRARERFLASKVK